MIHFKKPEKGHQRKKGLIPQEVQFGIIQSIRRALGRKPDNVVAIHCVGFQTREERDRARNLARDLAQKVGPHARPAVVFGAPIISRDGQPAVVLSCGSDGKVFYR